MKKPYPVLLNCWKHHKGFIQQQILALAEIKNDSLLKKNLVFLGDSLMDLYTGDLDVDQIQNEIFQHLKNGNYVPRNNFYKLVDQRDGYFNVKLSDGSFWTTRKGEDPEKYVHIHPGRYSPFTVRVKSLTLKSAISIIYYSYLFRKDPFMLDFVNMVRQDFLNVSPLKNLCHEKGLGKIIHVLLEK